LLSIDDLSASSQFRDGAARLGTWVAQWADTRGTDGFTGGTVDGCQKPHKSGGVGWGVSSGSNPARWRIRADGD
jgi:hypothetical protein